MVARILKSTYIIGLMTMISRISGLIRDVVFANLLGDKAAADVFFVVFRIPNFFRRIFGEGAFSATFVPVFTEYRLHKSELENTQFLQLLIGKFSLILIICSLLGVLFAPILVGILAAGFLQEPEKFDLAVTATRIIFPYLFFISLIAASAGILNTCGRFAVPAATPILLNLCLISSAILIVPYYEDSPIVLSIGVLVAGGGQLLFQLPFLRKEKLTIRPRVIARKEDKVGNDGVRKVFKLIIPAIFGVSVAQVNVLISTLLASFMVTGSISWLYYSDRLMEFPVGVFGIALATAILPNLSKKHRAKSRENFSAILDWAVRLVLLICIPSTVGLVILSRPMITTIYFHGDFTEHGVTMSAASLVAYSIGLTAIVMVKVLAPGFYARQNIKTPVRIGMIAVGANILFSLLLFYPFKHVGLALATSIAAFINAGLLYIKLKQQSVLIPKPGWLLYMLKILTASAIMGLFLLWAISSQESWLNMGLWERPVRLFGIIVAGGTVYLLTLFLSGLHLSILWQAKGIN